MRWNTMTEQTPTQRLKVQLKRHPRVLQLLFAATTLLSQTGIVINNAGDATPGP